MGIYSSYTWASKWASIHGLTYTPTSMSYLVNFLESLFWMFHCNHELDRCSRYFCYDHNQPASPVHERSLPSWQIISYFINKDSHGLWEFPGRWGRRMGYGPCETFLQGRGENDPALPGRDRRFCWRNGTFDPISVTTPLLFFPLIMKFEINTRQTLCLEGHVLRRLQDLFDI